MHKTHNLKSLFPCGDQMIVMIDDRADVWQNSDALINVKLHFIFFVLYESLLKFLNYKNSSILKNI